MNQPLLQVRGVHKAYRRGTETIYVLDALDLTVAAGDFVALMGPSGSGKTTLLNLIGGLDRPTQGEIEVGGRRIDNASGRELARWRARHIGFVFALYNLIPVLNVARNVELPLLMTRLEHDERQQRVALALERVGMADRADCYPRQLSGAQEQRVGIARAIVSDPCVILADEPTGDLDRAGGDEILDLLVALNRDRGQTILMVTHDPRAARRARRIVQLDKGRLLGAEAAA